MWKTMIVGLLTMSLFTALTSYATTLGLMLLARLTVGLSEGLYQTSYYALIGYVFFRKRGLAMGLFSGLFAVGIAITPPVTLYFYGLANDSWGVCFEYMEILGFALGLSALAASRSLRILEPPNRTASTSEPTRRAWYRDWRLLLVVIAMSSLGLTEYAYLGLMPTYFRVYQHMSRETVARVISLSGWSSFVLGLVGGFASDRLGRLKIIGIYGLVSFFVS
jgi:MFS family permease